MAAEQMAEPRTGSRPPCRPPRPLGRHRPATSCSMLQADGRASIRSVAERVHVSRANAYARINRLIEDGVIRGFGARVDHERAGQGASRVHHAEDRPELLAHGPRTAAGSCPGPPTSPWSAATSTYCCWCTPPDNRALRELVLTRLQAIPEVLSTRTLLVFEETDLDAGPGRPAEPTPEQLRPAPPSARRYPLPPRWCRSGAGPQECGSARVRVRTGADGERRRAARIRRRHPGRDHVPAVPVADLRRPTVRPRPRPARGL